MAVKRIIIHMTEAQRVKYNPPKGIDISWHNDGTCTIMNINNNISNINKAKKELGNGKELPAKAGIGSRKARQ